MNNLMGVDIIVVNEGHKLYNESNDESLVVIDGNTVKTANGKLYVTENDFVKIKEQIKNV